MTKSSVSSLERIIAPPEWQEEYRHTEESLSFVVVVVVGEEEKPKHGREPEHFGQTTVDAAVILMAVTVVTSLTSELLLRSHK